jgi:hypothetical protein
VLAEASYGPDGTITRKHDITASEVDVGGQAFRFANGAFTLPGGTQTPVPADTVFALMKQAGVTGQFQEAKENKAGVVSAALSFSFPVSATPATSAGEVTVTLGRASATVTAVALPGIASSGASGSGAPPIASAPSPSASNAAQSRPSDLGPSTPTAGPPTTANDRRPSIATVGSPVTHKLLNIYLALAAAALLAFGTATGIRWLGVKPQWRS